VVKTEAGRGTDAVGIKTFDGDFALREIGVDIAAVHRRRDEQGQHPQRQCPIQLAAGHAPVAEGEPPEHQPRERHHHRAGGRHGQRHRLDA
jgi:hypothetical protein